MIGWIHVTLAVASAGIFLLLFFYFYHRKPPQPVAGDPSGSPRKTLFNWSDNPALITDAVENGWSRFAFTDYTSSSSVRSNRFLSATCVDGPGGDEDDVEINWEVCQGSADFLQKIRLNSGLRKIIKPTTTTSAMSAVMKSALPLPGPALGNSSAFPQEAYFEITVLSFYEDDVSGKGRVNTGEGEDIKLIEENGVNGRGVHVNFEELRGRSCEKGIVEGRNEVAILVSVGLTGGGAVPVKVPGSFPGSVGFHSDGSIYLDGVKLVYESNIERWDKANKVIGCGYNPSEKKVFFTLDSKFVHEINCKEDEFGAPLYPTLAANVDVTVLVNFGQSIFKYVPANLHRTQNPCFVGPMANSASLGYEDSKELFSMGNLDSQWLHQTARSSGPYHSNVNKGKMRDYDEGSEGDMFEIVIESNSYRKSPSILS
ncbi:hypothetical protein SSX86_025408 [Deinandra increscens subsp. villosa]|uniref:B30.2/SPRY domain-containing protein n=1 Tax=Deinandra increscens subsp. villosa TaxID=3103831 RepID=A0AAP0GP12_9ASTR